MEKMCPHPAVTRIEAADAADAIPATLDRNADCARGLLAMVTTFRAGIVIPKLALRQLTISFDGAVSVRHEERSC